MNKGVGFCFALLALTVSWCATLFAEEPAAISAVPAQETSESSSAAMPAMDTAMMEKMKTMMSPNEFHKVFESFVGKWSYTGKFWMSPEAPAQDMTGTSDHEIIYGGRFLKQTVSGPWMGQQFEGLGYAGYDNVKAEYFSIWMDNMGTGMMTASGQYDAASKTLTMSGVNSCPMTGEKDRKGRSTWTIDSADQNTYASYAYGPDGKEYKAMEIVYTRAV